MVIYHIVVLISEMSRWKGVRWLITCTLASIWATNYLAGIVISVKILGLKFMPYIVDIESVY